MQKGFIKGKNQDNKLSGFKAQKQSLEQDLENVLLPDLQDKVKKNCEKE